MIILVFRLSFRIRVCDCSIDLTFYNKKSLAKVNSLVVYLALWEANSSVPFQIKTLHVYSTIIIECVFCNVPYVTYGWLPMVGAGCFQVLRYYLRAN